MKAPGILQNLLCLVGSVVLGGGISNGYDFPNPANRLGMADEMGYLSIWCNFDRDLELAGGHGKIPLRFQFSSNQRRMVDSCLGHGWWVPMLESAIYQKSEREVLLNGLGGESINLIRDPDRRDEFQSINHQWKGALLGGDRFKIDGPDGWAFLYDAGRIRQAVTPKGDTLKWIYEKDRVKKIESTKFGVLLSATFESDSGLLQRIDYNKGDWVAFGYGDYPVMVNIQEEWLPVEILPTVNQIVTSDEFQAEFILSPPRDGQGYKMQISESGEGESLKPSVLEWDQRTNGIVSDDLFTYEVKFLNDNQKLPQLIRTDDSGKYESYYFDPKSATAVRTNLNGITKKFAYVGTPGKSFMKIRQVEVVDGQDSKRIDRRYYDRSGRLLRHIASGRIFVHKYDGEQIEPMMVIEKDEATGKTVSEKFYEKGSLIKDIRPNEIVEFAYPEPGVVEKLVSNSRGELMVSELSRDGRIFSKTIPDVGRYLIKEKQEGDNTIRTIEKSDGTLQQIVLRNGRAIQELRNGVLRYAYDYSLNDPIRIEFSKLGDVIEVTRASDRLLKKGNEALAFIEAHQIRVPQ